MISTTMNSEKYVELLEKVLVPFAENIMAEDFIFKQDNVAITLVRELCNGLTSEKSMF